LFLSVQGSNCARNKKIKMGGNNNQNRSGNRGGGGNRGGRGGGGNRGPPRPSRTAPEAIEVLSLRSPVHLNKLDGYGWYTLTVTTSLDLENPRNPKNVDYGEYDSRLGLRILKKEIEKFLRENFQDEAYTWDGAQIVLTSKLLPVRKQSHEFTLAEGRAGEVKIFVLLSQSGEKTNEQCNELSLSLSHVINRALEEDINDTHGFNHKDSRFPGINSPLGKILNSYIPNRLNKDVRCLKPFVPLRGFNTDINILCDMNKNPKGLSQIDSAGLEAEIKRGAYVPYLAVLPKTTLVLLKPMTLIDFLNFKPDSDCVMKSFWGRTNNATDRMRNINVQNVLKTLKCKKIQNKYKGKAGNMVKIFDILIEDVCPQNAQQYTFKTKEGDKMVETTVAKYLKTKYNITLQYPQLPLLKIKKKPGQMFNEMIPAELLELPSQVVSTFGNTLQNSYTLVAQIATDVGALNMGEVISYMNTPGGKIRTMLDNWGIKIPPNAAAIKTKAILAVDPLIQYGNRVASVRDGRWNMAECSLKHGTTGSAKKVLYIDLGSRYTNAKKNQGSPNIFQEYAKFMISERRKLIISNQAEVPVPVPYVKFERLFEDQNYRRKVEGSPSDRENFHKEFISILKDSIITNIGGAAEDGDSAIKSQVNQAIIVLPPASFGTLFVDFIYASVKNFFDGAYGIASQCSRPESTPIIDGKDRTENNKMQFIDALLTGANIKAGGMNFQVVAKDYKFDKGTMLVGMDLQHSSVMGIGKISTVGVVASVDESGTNFVAAADVQLYKTDIIEQMSKISETLLTRRAALQKKLYGKEFPITNLLIFRDGIDFGSHNQVLNKEMNVLAQAVQKKYGKQPKVMGCAVMKRHNFRMCPVDLEKRDRNGNAPNVAPGMVVGVAPQNMPDRRESTSPNPAEPVFFIKGHEAIPGSTACPVRIAIIKNNTQWDAWDVAQISFSLMHNDQNVTKSVSLPAPTMYSHKLCEILKPIVIDFQLSLIADQPTLQRIQEIVYEYVGTMSNLAFL